MNTKRLLGSHFRIEGHFPVTFKIGGIGQNQPRLRRQRLRRKDVSDLAPRLLLHPLVDRLSDLSGVGKIDFIQKLLRQGGQHLEKGLFEGIALLHPQAVGGIERGARLPNM